MWMHDPGECCWRWPFHHSEITETFGKENFHWKHEKIFTWTLVLSFQKATNLSSRPFLHNSTIVLILIAIMITCRFYVKSVTVNFSLIAVIIAMLTHHLRDANRRGLWFHPFGSTKPIPTAIYVTLIVLLPLLLSHFIPATPMTLKYSRINNVFEI